MMHHVHVRMHQVIAHAKMVANATVHHAAVQFVNVLIAKNAVVIIAHAQQVTVRASANQVAK